MHTGKDDVEAIVAAFTRSMLLDVSLRVYVEGNDLRHLKDAYRTAVMNRLGQYGGNALLDPDGRTYRGVNLIRVQNHMNAALEGAHQLT